MVLGKLPVPGRPTILITFVWEGGGGVACGGGIIVSDFFSTQNPNLKGQGPTVLAVGACGDCLDIFTIIYTFYPLSTSLWETAQYRLKYCLKGALNQKPTNKLTVMKHFVVI